MNIAGLAIESMRKLGFSNEEIRALAQGILDAEECLPECASCGAKVRASAAWRVQVEGESVLACSGGCAGALA